MKRIVAILFTVVLVFTMAVPALAADASDLAGTTINVYNWGEYISDGSEGSMDINAEFTKRTGIKVNYNNYDTNENMYAKLKSDGVSFDIVIPSDYMIERLINEDMLQKIDFSNIPNYKYIDAKYKGLYFDPKDEYSVPYNVGMVGLIYNTKMVKEAPTSWNVMWDEQYKGKVLMFDNPRDAFGIAQKLLGQSFNTTDEAEWRAAADKLKAQKPILQGYVMDDIFRKMESGEAAIAPYYAGDFITMHSNNPDLAFVYPQEGVNIFVDSICIPKNAKNKAAAEAYINFLLDPDIAVENANYLGYATPNTAVLTREDYELKGNEYLYPEDQKMPKTEYFYNLPQKTLTLMTDLWSELKASQNIEAGEEQKTDYTWLYVGVGAVVVIAAAVIVYKVVKKKKRDFADAED
ncbi:MAG: spermidine/putrescine ABC transporter substrate-binding protein [Candidatus Fimivicinus sp.]|nr:spermidine/putrescine ABC transporter substrate-binding protein [Oscillospiraceae bacterium]MDY5591214.1 spermidine/putrescine ABC transporter substrate-binding protein [Candidatus Fimivicinus sp.]